MEKLLKSYLSQLQKVASHGDAREESFYPVFENFIKELANIKKIKNIDVTTLPKKTEAGNPDFRIWDGKYHIGGYQVLHKYLKDRKGRIMDDAPRYCRIVTAIIETIKIQEKIDRIYPEIEEELIEFKKL